MEGRRNRILVNIVTCIILCWGLIACGGSPDAMVDEEQVPVDKNAIAETAPPSSIRALQTQLAPYQPQVHILSPAAETVLTETNVEVQLEVQDFPVFRDEEFQLGPHLQVMLDNATPVSVYDLTAPVVFENVEPGTHLLRVFAVSPWGESLKNEGAYAQTQFAVLTRDRNHQPNPNLPLLTYNSPQGIYGAEPVLLDFFLTNAPLRLPGESTLDESSIEEVSPPDDWRIRVTVNDQSFLLDEWQAIYLEGFKPGLNWVKLEFINAQGQLVDNVFNNTARLVEYQPGQSNPLANLIAGRIPTSLQTALVDPDYRDQLQAAEEIKEIDAASPNEEGMEEASEDGGLSEESSNSESFNVEPSDAEEVVPSTLVELVSPDLEVKSEIPEEAGDSADSEASVNLEETSAIAPLSADGEKQNDPHPESESLMKSETHPSEAVEPIQSEVATEDDVLPIVTPENSELEEATDLPLILDAEGTPVVLPSEATSPLSVSNESDNSVVLDEFPEAVEVNVETSNSIDSDELAPEGEDIQLSSTDDRAIPEVSAGDKKTPEANPFLEPQVSEMSISE